ncbi:MAG: RHS repeat protein, partial [Gammaproteobacteria bacterium]|nr:RHS repeat protein [Gammaproteobacteria bacterium]
EFDYDAAGLLDFVRLPEGVTFDYRWNEAHLLESVIDSAGNRVEYTYDARGQRISERFVDSVLATRKSTAFEYSARKLLTAVREGANPATVIDYDDARNPVTVTDPNGNGTIFQYDALNRLTRMIDPLNGPALPTEYRYDAHDNVEFVAAPNGAVTTYSYDDLGNLLREQSPDRGLTLYGYDAAGNLTCKADARITNGVDYSTCAAARTSGAAWVYTYDALNRVDTIDYLDTPAIPDVDYDYDTGPLHQQPTSVLNTTGAGQAVLTDFEYDVWGNRTAQIEVAPGRSGTVTNSVSYEYDRNDQLTRMTYPNGRSVNYARTSGRITSVTTDSPFDGTTRTLVDLAIYYPFGPAGIIEYGSGLRHYRTIDAAYRPADFILTSPDGIADFQAYSLDSMGNVLSVVDQFEPDDSISFAYDALNRLVDDSRIDGDSSVDTYTYDPNGNRLVRHADRPGYSEQAITMVGGSNRQSSVNASAIVYDAGGNVLENGAGLRAFFDSANRLASLNRGGTSTTHLYTGTGGLAKLVRLSNCSCSCQRTHEYFAFAPDGRALTHYSENRVRFSTDYVWLDGIPIAAIEERFGSDGAHLAGSTVITYLHADHLGTPVLGTDGVGAVVWENTPDAFGGAIIATAGPDVRLRFPGQFDLGVGGIHYNHFRDYDSKHGRFLESDPVGLPGGLNTFAYGFNNPVANADPYGLFSVRELLANPDLREASRDPRIRGALSYFGAKLAEYAANETCDPLLRGITNLGAAGFALTSSAQFGVAALGSFVVAGSASTTGIGVPAAVGASALGVLFSGFAGLEAVDATRYLEESVRSFKGESDCNEKRPCPER